MNDMEAGNGLLSRRWFLKTGGAGLTGMLILPVTASTRKTHEKEVWTTHSGTPPSAYGSQSKHASLRREHVRAHPFGSAAGASSTPLESLNGTITPNSLHFERHHSGIPDIDPTKHSLTIYGDVKRQRQFAYEDLFAYPLESHTYFLECSGNSYLNSLPQAQDMTAGELNGLISCAEWTGIPLHYLLEETGISKDVHWIIAEGADASGNNRSIPLNLALDNAMVALYQNGEPLRPSQGFPMRLFVPGCEGNISIKWLRSIKLQNRPAYTREETSKYTDLLKSGKAEMFTLRMGAKSVITSPSGKMTLKRRGVYEISGLAWSGYGTIKAVEVSADGGKSWAQAELQSEPGALRLARFRIPWNWQGQSATLQSRAIDDKGHVQPGRGEAKAGYSMLSIYHYNGVQSWQVSTDGRVKNVFA